MRAGKKVEMAAAKAVRYSQTEAKDNFLSICKDVAKTGKRVYVRDKIGLEYMTIAPAGDPATKKGHIKPIEVAAQRFKNYFSRFSYLIKDGIVCRVMSRDAEPVIVRRHTRYHEPLQDVINAWVDQLKRMDPVDDADRDD